MNILILEDNIEIANLLKDALDTDNIQICYRMTQALQELKKPYDLMLVDLGLPDGDGLEFIEYVRSYLDTPLVVISGNHNEEKILKSYALKIDDYIEKPFRIRILKAKINSLTERMQSSKKRYSIGSCILSGSDSWITFEESKILLSNCECALLATLFKAFPHRVQKNQMINEVFRETGKEMSEATLSVRISNLKNKLTHFPVQIMGRRSQGFYLKEKEYEEKI